jgi:hypothetical protein
VQPVFKTKFGKIILQDSLDLMRNEIKDESVDLVVKSSPFRIASILPSLN